MAKEVTMNELDQFESLYEEAEAESGNVPEGTYDVALQSLQLKKSKSGNMMVVFKMTVLLGEHRKKTIWKNSTLSKETMKWFKADMGKIGINTPKLKEVVEQFEEQTGKVLEVYVKQKEKFANVYINKLIYNTLEEYPADTSDISLDIDFDPRKMEEDGW